MTKRTKPSMLSNMRKTMQSAERSVEQRFANADNVLALAKAAAHTPAVTPEAALLAPDSEVLTPAPDAVAPPTTAKTEETSPSDHSTHLSPPTSGVSETTQTSRTQRLGPPVDGATRDPRRKSLGPRHFRGPFP